MRQTPFGHDRTAARDDARHAVCGHGDKGQTHARMDSEIVHALFSLLDEGVAENFPGQVFGLAVDFFQGLIDRHSADRHG